MKYKFERKRNKLPIFVWYVIGVICADLTMTIIVSALCGIMSSFPFWISFWRGFLETFLLFLPVLVLWVLSAFGDAVTSVLIDVEDQEICIEYHIFILLFFKKRTCVIKLENFDYFYEKYNHFHHRLIRRIAPLTTSNARLIFYDKTDASIAKVLLDSGGWTTKQLEEIYHKLLEYKEPLETCLGPKFSKKYKRPMKYYR